MFESEQTQRLQKAIQQELLRDQRRLEARLRFMNALAERKARLEMLRRKAIEALEKVQQDDGIPGDLKALMAHAGRLAMDKNAPMQELKAVVEQIQQTL